MSAKLVPLDTAREACRASVIETLAQTMEQAVAGDIVAIAIAVVRPDLAINTTMSDSDCSAGLLGATALLHHRALMNVERQT